MANLKTTLRKTFSPGFILTLGLLLAAMVGLRGLTGAWEWAFTKKPLPMRRHFSQMPLVVGPYERIKTHELTDVTERRLSTTNYQSAVYRDHRVDIGQPGSGLQFHSVYYTGNEEPVSAAHVPEVCYVGGGFQRRGLEVTEISLDIPAAEATGKDGKVRVPIQEGGTVTLPGLDIPVRQFEFLTPGSKNPGSVIYFFIYNGTYVSSRSKIGLQFLDRSSPYVYYAKVEVMPGRIVMSEEGEKPTFSGGVADSEEAREMAAEFLSHLLPEVVACLPDWEAVKAGRVPEAADSEADPEPETATGLAKQVVHP